MGTKINILIRTSDRPKSFKRCISSILVQSYKDYRIIVSADNRNTERYVKSHGIEPIRVTPTKRDENNTAPWNLYLNSLISEVSDGWIFILDDDDYFSTPNVLSIISERLVNKKHLYVWKMKWPNGRVIPEDEYFGKLPFVRKHIGMPCFCFHSDFKKYAVFDSMRAGDFRVSTRLSKFVDKVEWINMIPVIIGNKGLVGRKVDIL